MECELTFPTDKKVISADNQEKSANCSSKTHFNYALHKARPEIYQGMIVPDNLVTAMNQQHHYKGTRSRPSLPSFCLSKCIILAILTRVVLDMTLRKPDIATLYLKCLSVFALELKSSNAWDQKVCINFVKKILTPPLLRVQVQPVNHMAQM